MLKVLLSLMLWLLMSAVIQSHGKMQRDQYLEVLKNPFRSRFCSPLPLPPEKGHMGLLKCSLTCLSSGNCIGISHVGENCFLLKNSRLQQSLLPSSTPCRSYLRKDLFLLNPIFTEHLYIGCFKDNHPRDLLPVRYVNTSMSVNFCWQECFSKEYTFVGLQFGTECFCGHSFGIYGFSTMCNTPCSGNSLQTCGNGLVNSVYSVCRKGMYGAGCSLPCRCPHWCHRQSGACV